MCNSLFYFIMLPIVAYSVYGYENNNIFLFIIGFCFTLYMLISNMRIEERFINPGIINNEKNCISSVINLENEKLEKFNNYFNEYLNNATDHEKLEELYNIIPRINIIIETSIKDRIDYISDNGFINYLEILDETLGNGSYGIIKNAKHNNILLACKYFQVKEDMDIKEIILNQFKENIIHILLHCFRNNINNCLNGQYINCIPDIHNIIKCDSNYISEAGQNNEMLVTLIEKLDMNLATFLSKSSGDDILEFKIIALITYNILSLQRSIDFLHKDLHVGNIMIKMLSEPKRVNIILNNITYSFETNIQTFIIDYGMCCVNLSKCLENNECVMYLNGVYDNSKNCKNTSHDLRILFAHLHDKVKSRKLRLYIVNKLTKYEHQINSIIPYFHNFYTQTIDNYDSDFDAEIVLKEVLDIIQKLDFHYSS